MTETTPTPDPYDPQHERLWHEQHLAAALADFIDAESFSRLPRTRARHLRVLARLHQYLDEVDVLEPLGPGPAALLADERAERRRGAFLRVLGFEDLVCCLPGFLEPPWLPLAPAERRTQISLVDRLVRHLRTSGWIAMDEVACAVYELEHAVRIARRGIVDDSAVLFALDARTW